MSVRNLYTYFGHCWRVRRQSEGTTCGKPSEIVERNRKNRQAAVSSQLRIPSLTPSQAPPQGHPDLLVLRSPSRGGAHRLLRSLSRRLRPPSPRGNRLTQLTSYPQLIIHLRAAAKRIASTNSWRSVPAADGAAETITALALVCDPRLSTFFVSNRKNRSTG